MSVQEIQAALERMSPEELREVDHALNTRLQKAEASEDDCSYAMKEYDMTREELDAFVTCQNANNREMEKKGLTVRFEGPFNLDWLD